MAVFRVDTGFLMGYLWIVGPYKGGHRILEIGAMLWAMVEYIESIRGYEPGSLLGFSECDYVFSGAWHESTHGVR